MYEKNMKHALQKAHFARRVGLVDVSCTSCTRMYYLKFVFILYNREYSTQETHKRDVDLFLNLLNTRTLSSYKQEIILIFLDK